MRGGCGVEVGSPFFLYFFWSGLGGFSVVVPAFGRAGEWNFLYWTWDGLDGWRMIRRQKVILVALSHSKKGIIDDRRSKQNGEFLASMRPMNTLLRICGCSDSFPPVTLSPCLLFPMFPSPVPLLSVFVRGCFCLFRLFHSPPWLVNHFWSPRSALPQVHLLK